MALRKLYLYESGLISQEGRLILGWPANNWEGPLKSLLESGVWGW